MVFISCCREPPIYANLAKNQQLFPTFPLAGDLKNGRQFHSRFIKSLGPNIEIERWQFCIWWTDCGDQFRPALPAIHLHPNGPIPPTGNDATTQNRDCIKTDLSNLNLPLTLVREHYLNQSFSAALTELWTVCKVRREWPATSLTAGKVKPVKKGMNHFPSKTVK